MFDALYIDNDASGGEEEQQDPATCQLFAFKFTPELQTPHPFDSATNANRSTGVGRWWASAEGDGGSSLFGRTTTADPWRMRSSDKEGVRKQSKSFPVPFGGKLYRCPTSKQKIIMKSPKCDKGDMKDEDIATGASSGDDEEEINLLSSGKPAGDAYEEVATHLEINRERRKSDSQRFGKEAVFISHSLNPTQILTQDDFADISELSKDRKDIWRNSVLSVDAVKSLPKETGKKLTTPAGRATQFAAVITTLIVLSVTPLIEQQALRDPETGKKSRHFLIQSPFIVSYGISIILGYLTTLLWHGTYKLRECYKWQPLLWNLPSAALYCWGDAASMTVQVSLDGTIWKVMNQIKLCAFAFFGWILFGKKQTATQWGLILATTATVAAYCLTSATSEHIPIESMMYGCFVISITTSAGLYSEYALKRLAYSFPIQMAQGRTVAILPASAMLVYAMYTDKTWDLFLFGGWTNGVWLMALNITLKDWLTAFIVKSLDSVWKSMVTAFSIGLTYVLSCYYFADKDNEWSAAKFTLVLAMMLDIVSYALAKRDESRILQLRADSERRLRISSRSGSVAA